MKPVYLSGRGLACALGLEVESALVALRHGGVATSTYSLPGDSGRLLSLLRNSLRAERLERTCT